MPASRPGPSLVQPGAAGTKLRAYSPNPARSLYFFSACGGSFLVSLFPWAAKNRGHHKQINQTPWLTGHGHHNASAPVWPCLVAGFVRSRTLLLQPLKTPETRTYAASVKNKTCLGGVQKWCEKEVPEYPAGIQCTTSASAVGTGNSPIHV